MKIAVGNSRMDKKWKNQDISWADLCARCGSTIRTTETVEEYRKLKKGQQDGIKDVGGFVGGHLREGRRKNGIVLCRSLLTLDMDYGTPDTAPSKLPSFQAMSDLSLIHILGHFRCRASGLGGKDAETQGRTCLQGRR